MDECYFDLVKSLTKEGYGNGKIKYLEIIFKIGAIYDSLIEIKW